MRLALPHSKPSTPVISYKSIAADAKEMLIMVNGEFAGLWKNALALSHTQVSYEPKKFFVVNKSLKKAFGGHDVIINAKLVEGFNKVPFREACMSYPHRPEIKTRRYSEVSVIFEYKGILGLRKTHMRLSGLAAIVIQHEIDHAKGLCIFEKFKKT